MTERKDTGSFRVLDENGRGHLVTRFTEIHHEVIGEIEGLHTYEIVPGGPELNQLDENTFQNPITGEMLRRESPAANG